MLLVFPGPTYPITGLPTSVRSQQHRMRRETRNAVPVPKSALEILCTNHQIHDEAKKIFYHDNELVFSHPVDLLAFLFTLGDGRLEGLRSVTLFHMDYCPSIDKEGLKLRDGLLALRLLPGLRKFHLLIDFPKRGVDYNPAESGATYPSDLPHVEGLFKLKNVSDIACRHLPAEDWKNNPRSQTQPGKDMSGAYKHFSHGLQLAQKGSANSKLYTSRKWHNDGLWPVLNGSDCGVKKGCTCGQSEDASE